MAGHGTKLGRKQEEAIAALLSHRNVEEAAHAANIVDVRLTELERAAETRTQ